MMNTFQKMLACLVIGLIVFDYGCKKDDPVSCNYVTELQAESTALSNAATAYGTNPTTANCQAFVSAYQNYLNAADDYVDCATAAGQGEQLQQSIDDAQAQLDLIQC